jgi:hypothetical protein
MARIGGMKKHRFNVRRLVSLSPAYQLRFTKSAYLSFGWSVADISTTAASTVPSRIMKTSCRQSTNSTSERGTKRTDQTESADEYGRVVARTVAFTDAVMEIIGTSLWNWMSPRLELVRAPAQKGKRMAVSYGYETGRVEAQFRGTGVVYTEL